MIQQSSYDEKVDSWAAGVVILELWTKVRATDFTKLLSPAIGRFFPTQEQLETIEDFNIRLIARQMLVKDPSKRISIIDIDIGEDRKSIKESFSSQESENEEDVTMKVI